MSKKIDVAQLVIRTESEGDFRYLMAQRAKDGYWEWIGGKKKAEESIEEAAIRELKEELKVNWSDHSFEIKDIAEPYKSRDNPKYRLNPVLVELGNDLYNSLKREHLSEEHQFFTWIELTEYDEYETLGQFKALKNLDLIEGDVALAVAENDGKYLVVKRSDQNTSSGRWGFVSGKIQSGESPEEAAVRELKEETGIKSELIKKGEFYIGKGELGYWRLFPVKLLTDSRKADLNWELSDYEWLNIDELSEKHYLGEMKSIEKLGLGERLQ